MSSSAQQPPSGKSDMTKSESLLILTGGRYYSPKISNLCYQLLGRQGHQGQQELLELLELLDQPDHLESRQTPERLGLLAPLVKQVLQAQQVQAVLLGQLEQLVLRALQEVKALKEIQAQPDPLAEQARRVLPALLAELEQRGPQEAAGQSVLLVQREAADLWEQLVQQARKAYKG